MSHFAVVLRTAAAVLFVAAVVAADPAPQSSLPWLIRGNSGPVARAGRTLFYAGNATAVPRASAVPGLAVFSPSDAAVEWIDQTSGSEIYGAISDGAGGWYAGGPFSTFGGLPRRGLVHLLPDGRVDPGFVADLNVGGNNNFGVFRMALNGSQLIIVGAFTTVNQVPRTSLAWINATTGQVLTVAPTILVAEMALSGNTLFVETVGVTALNATTGVALPGFAAVTLGGGNARAFAVDGPWLYIGGGFAMVNGVERYGLARVNATTGALDPGWNPRPMYFTGPGSVYGLAVSGGTVYVGGNFTAAGGQPRNYLAALSTTTGAATPWRADMEHEVTGLAILGDAVYVNSGPLPAIGPPRTGATAVSLATPAVVLPWDPAIAAAGLGSRIAAGSGKVAFFGQMIGGGAFRRPGLAAVDVVTGELLPWAPDFDFGSVNALLASGSRLIVGGSFFSVDRQPRFNLAAFDLETRALLPFAPVVNGRVTALAVVNGVVYVGGQFTNVNGAFRLNLAAIDLQSGQLLPWDPQADGVIAAMVAQSGSVIVSGQFTSLIGTNGFRTRVGVGEITLAGRGEVTTFDARVASGTVSTLATSGSTLFLGGTFTMVGDRPRQYAAGVNVVTGGILPWNPAPNGFVQGLSVNRDFVYMRGTFGTVGGTPRPLLARVNTTDGALSSWQLSFTPYIVGAVAAFDDGVMLSATPLSTSLYFENAMFLPEMALGGVPGPPAEPAVRVVGATLSLRFNPPVVGPRPSSYLLEAGTAPGSSNIGTIPLGTTSFSVAGVPPGLYYVRVRAAGAAGVGAPSREVVFTVGAATCTAAPAAPPVPTTTVAGAAVQIDWRPAPGPEPTSYTLIAGSSSGFTNIGTLPLGSARSFSTGGVPAGAYFVRVIASNPCGLSAPSADGVLRVAGAPGPPGAPLEISGTAAGGAVTVSWLAPSGGAPTSHLLEAGSGPSLSNLAVVSLGAGTGLSTAGVPPGTYYLRVRALNAAGISPPSGELILVVP